MISKYINWLFLRLTNMSFEIPKYGVSEKFQGLSFPEFNDELTYTTKGGKEREYDGFDNMQLMPIVGSANRRHIYRKNAWKNKYAFDEWHKGLKDNDPRKKYVGVDGDLDGDQIPEFLVKRGDRVVAVNGYSTTKSDYPIEYEYYKANPTKEQREALPMKPWLMEHYKEHIKIDPDTGLPSDEYYEWRAKEVAAHKDNRRIPMLTPSSVFKNEFVYRIYQSAIESSVEGIYPKARSDKKVRESFRSELVKACSKYHQDEKWLMRLAKDLYDNYIKIPAYEFIMNGQSFTDKKGKKVTPRTDYPESFVKTDAYKNASNVDERNEAFIKYVMGKPIAKDICAQRVTTILNKKGKIHDEIYNRAMKHIGTPIKRYLDTLSRSLKAKKAGERPPSRGGLNLGGFSPPSDTE